MNKNIESAQRTVLSRIERNRDYIVKFLRHLISTPSVTGDEREIQRVLAKKIDEMGLIVDEWEPNVDDLHKHPGYVAAVTNYTNRPNVVGIYKGSGSGKSLLLNGHVDVIPPGSLKMWKYHPWKGEINDGKVYGRGASDMKSGLTAMTMALDAILQSDIVLTGDVILEYTVDEELSGNGTLACILRGYTADAGICCETSSLHVQPASIGRIWFEVFVKGKSAGIQRREEGVNAIMKGYKVVEAVSDFEESRIRTKSHPLYPNPQEALPCMVCVFNSGSYPSAFPDTCHLKGSIATLPGEDSRRVKQEFREYLHTTTQKDEWLKDHPPDVKFTGYFAEPSEISRTNPIVQTITSNYRKVQSEDPIISGRLGAADSRHLNTYGETPSVIFGPGRTEQMHAVDEWVFLEDVISATKILALTILDWCGISGESYD